MEPYLENDALVHYGMPRRSGRYPWGSGDNPYQRTGDFLARVEELKGQGKSEKEIAEELGILGETGKPSTGRLRTQIRWAKDERKLYKINQAKSLAKDGLGPTAIGNKLGESESTIRGWLEPHSTTRLEQARETASHIKKLIDDSGMMLDIGKGVEKELNISKERLEEALYSLELEGYPIYKNRVQQLTNAGNYTTQRLICPPGTKYKDTYNLENIRALNEDQYYSPDGGEHFDKIVYPKSLDSKRLAIRYADDVGPDGARGIDKDGIVEIRRGVKDLSLGDSRYSQVRILVDDTHYIKGMAVYSDNLPDGVDIVFNTNKTPDVAKMDVLKPIKNDPDNPFGSLIKSQMYYEDEQGNRQLGLINKRADQGDWSEWQDALPSQFLGKQSLELAKKQLDLAKADKLAEFDEYCNLQNPTVKKHFLKEFADKCDSAAVHLKGAALPGQKYHVIIPVNTLKDNEIYAPQYESGTKLALVRYPHGGIFEIPILTVNNKHAPAKQLIGEDSIDAVGINKNIADRLSGADFDGDTVMCIPTHDREGRVQIKTMDPLKGLEGFDPKLEYPERPGMKYMKDPNTKKDNTQLEMGMISNLITDMTLQGASRDELAAAVRHSMVVIDAGKHKLDYKKSEIDNNIAALRKEYQVHIKDDGSVKYGGAATILSRSSGQATVARRQGNPNIDPETGKVSWKEADDLYYPVGRYDKTTGSRTLRTVDGKKVTYNVKNDEEREAFEPVKRKDEQTGEVSFTNKAGDIVYKKEMRTQRSTNMMETDDAYSLVSPGKYPMEILYADYANSMKALANRARKEMLSTGKIEYDKTAARTYQAEVSSLNSKLNEALKNAPRERAAQRQAGAVVKAKQLTDPDMTKGDLKKEQQRALSAARQNVNSMSRRDRNIKITDNEWAAIQAGAISETRLRSILANSDPDKLKALATPRTTKTVSDAKINKIKTMGNSNYTLEQIAKATGLSPSTVYEYLKGKKE